MGKLITLRGPVGDLTKTNVAGNFPEDIRAVKMVLRKLGINPTLEGSVTATPFLRSTILRLQKLFKIRPDGRIDPRGSTLRKLNEMTKEKTIVVNLDRQILQALLSLQRVYEFHCASGDREHRTPPGYYKIYRKHKTYRSKTYDVQMDYAMFFHRGYAIHMARGVRITSILKWAGINQLGSHGCVRLEESDASKLFSWAQMKTPVLVLSRTR